MKKIYLIGIGGIGVSALARYYNNNGYLVFGSDKVDSPLIEKLKEEGININIGENENNIDSSFEKIIYSEAITNNNKEYKKASELGLKLESYPEALGSISNDKNLIAVTGTHGKSTTSAMISLILKNSDKNFSSIIGTLLKEFDGKNFYQKNSGQGEKNFVIEACEYKESFLNYTPNIGVITNIDIDHLDYYKNEDNYINAFKKFIDNIKSGGYVILDGQELNTKGLVGQRKDIEYIIIDSNKYVRSGQERLFPKFDLKIPGQHILQDAKNAYIATCLLGIEEDIIINSLNNYNGAWRRTEITGITNNGNIVISDYGHHPTEIKLTLNSIKQKYTGKKLLTIFQPHQYSRTLNLIDEFVDSFKETDILVVPDIYESRDTEEDKKKMNTQIFLEKINHNNKINGNGMKNTLDIIKKLDEENKNNLVILLMGAGNIDNLRYDIEYQK